MAIEGYFDGELYVCMLLVANIHTIGSVKMCWEGKQCRVVKLKLGGHCSGDTAGETISIIADASSAHPSMSSCGNINFKLSLDRNWPGAARNSA